MTAILGFLRGHPALRESLKPAAGDHRRDGAAEAGKAGFQGTTVYFVTATPTEAVKSDVNTRVKAAPDAGGIEIPCNSVNVAMRD